MKLNNSQLIVLLGLLTSYLMIGCTGAGDAGGKKETTQLNESWTPAQKSVRAARRNAEGH